MNFLLTATQIVFKKQLTKFVLQLSPMQRKVTGVGMLLLDTMTKLEKPVNTAVERQHFGTEGARVGYLLRLLLIRMGFNLRGQPLDAEVLNKFFRDDPLFKILVQQVAVKSDRDEDAVRESAVSTLLATAKDYRSILNKKEASQVDFSDAGDTLESMGYFGHLFTRLIENFKLPPKSGSQKDSLISLCLEETDDEEGESFTMSYGS